MNLISYLELLKAKVKADKKFAVIFLGLIVAGLALPYFAIPLLVVWWFYKKSNFSKRAKILTTSVIGGLFLLLITWVTVAYSRDAEPHLFLNAPAESTTVQASEIAISGTYDPADRKVWINGQPINAENGAFETTYPLEMGENKIEISAGNWKRDRVTLIVTRELSEAEKSQIEAENQAREQQAAAKAAVSESEQEEATQVIEAERQAKDQQAAADQAAKEEEQKAKEAATQEEQKREQAAALALSEYGGEMLVVMTRIQIANEAVVNAGSAGSDLDFPGALAHLQEAESGYKNAKIAISQVQVVPGAEEVDRLINQALDKYILSVAIYQDGIRTINADKIYSGIAIYEQGTELINQATEETNKLVNK